MTRENASPYISTTEAAATLAVSVSTVKRWVDEGILPAHLTAGGHRKLKQAEVKALARRNNLPSGEPELLVQPSRRAKTRDPKAIAEALQEHLVAGRTADVRDAIRHAMASGLSIEALADAVIMPAMTGVGCQWETHRIDVWEEHRCTQLCSAALYDLKRELESRAERNRPVAIGAAPEGDPYLLASLLAQLVLLDAGWDAMNLGPNTPLSSLAKAIRRLHPKLIWLSVSWIPARPQFLESYRELARVAEENGVPIIVGGQALDADLRSTMTFSAYGDSLTRLGAFARALHPRPRRPRRGRPRINA